MPLRVIGNSEQRGNHTENHMLEGTKPAGSMDIANAPMKALELLLPSEAARVLRMSLRTFYEHVRRGDLAGVQKGCGRVRRRFLFERTEIEAFIARQRRAACPSIGPQNRRTTTMTSNIGGSGSTAQRNS